MKRKNNGFIKFIIIVGALAAIFVAISMIYKKYNRKKHAAEFDSFDFDDMDFGDSFDDYADDSMPMDANSDDIIEF